MPRVCRSTTPAGVPRQHTRDPDHPRERQVADAAVDAPATFESGGGKPRFYRLTPLGRKACSAEAARLSRFVEAAREKRLLKRLR